MINRHPLFLDRAKEMNKPEPNFFAKNNFEARISSKGNSPFLLSSGEVTQKLENRLKQCKVSF